MATLPQLLDRYQAASTACQDSRLDELIRLTYHSMAIEGTGLTLAQTENLIQSGQLIPETSLPDQWRMIDHHQALAQILAMASQHQPINRIALQDIATALVARTGGLMHSLLSCFDTSKGELRIHDAVAGRRPLVAARKLPAALDELFKSINTRMSQLKTPRQVYDLSFEAHFNLLTLHPFGAGNGLMARLLMNYIQHYHHLPMSLVYVDQRASYLTALEASWAQKTMGLIMSFMHNQLLKLLEGTIDQPISGKRTE